MNYSDRADALHLASLARTVLSAPRLKIVPTADGSLACTSGRPTPADALTFLCTLAVPDGGLCRIDAQEAEALLLAKRPAPRHLETARSADPALILHNLEARFLSFTDPDTRKALWEQLQALLSHTDFGLYDAFRLKAFIGTPFTERHLRMLFFNCYFFCMFLANAPARPAGPAPTETTADAMPVQKKVMDYDPLTDTFSRTVSTAVKFQVHVDGQTHLFRFEDLVLTYLRDNDLMIDSIDCTPGVLDLYCKPLPDGLKLVRLHTAADLEQARQAVLDHRNEFRSKVTWNGRELADMLFNGMTTGVWEAYGYRTPTGELASYIDFKRRACSDIEVGIQLTDPAYRKKHLAGSLIWLCLLRFMDADMISGTYEENMAMRKAMLNCGFRPQDFFDPVNRLFTNRIRERISPDCPEDPLARTNSVYYKAPSLSSRVWQSRREHFHP